MKIGIPKETAGGETRVALVPPHIKELLKKDHEIFVETGAGENAGFSDDDYKKEGAAIVTGAKELYSLSQAILKVQPPGNKEMELMKEGTVYIGFLPVFKDRSILENFNKKNITSFAMDFIPRITRAQSMDALSSMATVAGYKAVVMAADHLPKLFPLLMTAAGTVPPAGVLVLGAGVAGLQAIATAKRLGAKV
ncbi:MAG: NAD(P)(+) transhydrogenase (Re/Si-specific) subunit alpha, partial [bacterium]|nr:NAD(P)(+) transhydrogenase (Re/Si-specific) subunit alpha [bacterium]